MILCCGEALVEMRAAATADGDAAFVPEPAGTAFGTAVALGRLGAPTGFLGGLSGDAFGAMLAGALQAARVRHDFLPGRPEPTALAFRDEAGTTTLRAEATASRSVAEADLPDLPAEVAALFVGGAHLGAEPCGTAFESLARREAARRVVMLDPNIRPVLIAAPDRFRSRIARMGAAAHVLKLSETDLAWLCGPGAALDRARGLLGKGARLVVVTHGARGATALCASGAEVFVPAPSVTLADRRGAGDAFNAGLLAALHRAGALQAAALADLGPEALRRAVNLGVHAAAVAVSRPGANPPHAGELG
jgi:fructokinase